MRFVSWKPVHRASLRSPLSPARAREVAGNQRPWPADKVGPGTAHFVNRDMTQRLVAPRLDFGGTPSMCVVVSIGETDGHHCFKLHGAQQRQARR